MTAAQIGAIFHLKLKTITRSCGQSAVKASAYRRCANMTDQRTGERATYGRKRGHLAGGLVGWDGGAEALWNAAEAADNRRNSMTARHFEIALPAGLPLADQERLTRDLCQIIRRETGAALQWDIHAPDTKAGGDARNIHLHVMMTTRRVDGRMFGSKLRQLNDKATSSPIVKGWRKAWEGLVNDSLAQAGSTARVDCRSHKQRWAEDRLPGPAPEPQGHLGPTRAALERRGRRNRVGVRNDRLAEAGRLEGQIAALDRQLAHLRRQDRPSRAAWQAGRVVRAAGRLAVWTAGASAATMLRLAGFRVRRPRLPTRAVGTLAAGTAGLAVEAGRALARAVQRWPARRQTPAEVRAWWRAVVRGRPAAEVTKLRAEAFAALARRYPDQAERMAALRAASEALPRRWRLRLAEVDKETKEARLAATRRPAVDRAADVLAAAARGTTTAPARPASAAVDRAADALAAAAARPRPVEAALPGNAQRTPARQLPAVPRRADRADWRQRPTDSKGGSAAGSPPAAPPAVPSQRPVVQRRGSKGDGAKGDDAR